MEREEDEMEVREEVREDEMEEEVTEEVRRGVGEEVGGEEVEVDFGKLNSFLWRKRVTIVIIFLLIVILIVWYVLGDMAERQNEAREVEERLAGEFSGVNLNRMDRGSYRLRVEVFGDHGNPRREDTLIDFDRDLMIVIYEENEILAMNVENLSDDIEIVSFVLRGRLRNRDRSYEFNMIDVRTNHLYLGYREVSNPLPISIHTTDDRHIIEMNNYDWLRDMGEFRENFELIFFQVMFYLPEYTEDRLAIRYVPSTDVYEARMGRAFINEHLDRIEIDVLDEDEDETEPRQEFESRAEIVPRPEPEEVPGQPLVQELEANDETSIELGDHIGITQSFNVTTSLEEIEIRIENSGENWIDAPSYNMFDDVFDDVFEETFEIDETGVIELIVSEISNIDAMFVNSVEVEFISAGLYGTQNFNFNIEFE